MFLKQNKTRITSCITVTKTKHPSWTAKKPVTKLFKINIQILHHLSILVINLSCKVGKYRNKIINLFA